MNTQPSNRFATKSSPMRTWLPRSLMAALLLGAAATHGADTPAVAEERPLDLSLPRDRSAKADLLKKAGDGRAGERPYGSGYEARRLGAGESEDSVTRSSRAASSASDGAALRSPATGQTARALVGAHRGGGAGGRGRR